MDNIITVYMTNSGRCAFPRHQILFYRLRIVSRSFDTFAVSHRNTCTILFYFILFYFILFYFILFYFILFYFILFCTQPLLLTLRQRK